MMKMKTGLVLEGGGMRGLFSAGVMDVLMENGIEFDGIIGVSAGACFGCNYKSRQHGRPLRYNLRFAKDVRYCSLLSWLFTGDLVGAKFAYHTLPDRLDPFDHRTYEENPAEFHVVTTDVTTGEPVYKRLDGSGEALYEWIRASASMPVVSRPVEIEGRKMLDGGVTDSIPLRYFQEQGFARNLVVLTQPADYRKEPMRGRYLMNLLLRRYPRVAEALAVRHKAYNAQLDYVRQCAEQGTVAVICPQQPLPIGRISHNRAQMQQAYDLGRQAAERFLSDRAPAFMPDMLQERQKNQQKNSLKEK